MSYTGIPIPEGPTELFDTAYTIGQDNITPQIGPFGLDVHNPVFLISGLTIVGFVFLTLAFQQYVGPLFSDLRDWLTATFDWFFRAAGNVFLLLCLFLIFSPCGKVRICGRDAVPDHSYSAWFAMLFAAGMGIGLMFYGVFEPISHYSSAVAADAGSPESWAPLGGVAGDTTTVRHLGMAATIFHWALHPWAIYAVVELALALFCYNKGLPLTMRSIFYPIFGSASGAGWGMSSMCLPSSPRSSVLRHRLDLVPSRPMPASIICSACRSTTFRKSC